LSPLSHGSQASATATGAQAAGENIILSRALLESVGVFALSVGPQYAVPGQLLRVTLLPVLERLGDPSAAVASSAAAAFGCICRASGYASLTDLVTANADYVVDGLCAQLRRVDEHLR
jgi:TELO2-interacting protein 1